MTHLKFALAVFLSVLGTSSITYAFSTQSAGDISKGNTSNIADPDEQQPAFLTAPRDASSQGTSNQPSVGSDQNNVREKYLGLTQGFDQAYSRK